MASGHGGVFAPRLRFGIRVSEFKPDETLPMVALPRNNWPDSTQLQCAEQPRLIMNKHRTILFKCIITHMCDDSGHVLRFEFGVRDLSDDWQQAMSLGWSRRCAMLQDSEIDDEIRISASLAVVVVLYLAGIGLFVAMFVS